MSIASLQSPQQTYASYDDLLDDYYRRGWTDGMPIVPPTPDRARAFLERVGLRPDVVIGEVATRDVVVSAEHVAINAIMAGCRPEYMPVVLAAVRALLHPDSNAHCVSATLAGANQVVMINGPVRKELDVNCDLGCFGPGWRANATIGRAVRLLLRNTCNSLPGSLDRAVFSSPMRYSFCFGENEEESDWTPLHVQRGLKPTDSAVTVYSSQIPIEYDVSLNLGAEAILNRAADLLIVDGRPWVHLLGIRGLLDIVIVFGKEHMRFLSREGWSKARISEYLFDRMKDATPGARLGGGSAGGDKSFRLVGPENLLIVGAGGPGNPFTWILPPHCGLAVTRKVDEV
jgi:hypothetical protein